MDSSWWHGTPPGVCKSQAETIRPSGNDQGIAEGDKNERSEAAIERVNT